MALSDEHRKAPTVAASAGTTVVAWETLTGAPIEATVRRHGTGADTWPRAVGVTERDARAPSVAVTPTGVALMAWQGYDGDTPVIRVARNRTDEWSRPIIVSAGGRGARDPQIGVDEAGHVTVAWLADVGTLDSVVQVATTAEPDGPFGPPTQVGARGQLRHLRLAVGADGTAAIAWASQRPERAVFAAGRHDGRWGQVTLLSEPGTTPIEPGVAAAPGGRAAAIWTAETDAGAETTVAEFVAGSWQRPTVVDRAAERAREMSRPGRADTAPAVTVLPRGVAAAWARYSPGQAQVRGATRIDGDSGGDWSDAGDLSYPGSAAGGVHLIGAAGATGLAAWEELDGGLLRARVGRVGDAGGCVDLAPSAGETGGVRLAGLANPTAVFVDFARSRVMAVDLP